MGNPVYFRTYRSENEWAPGTISKVRGSRLCDVRSEGGSTEHRHADQLRKRITVERLEEDTGSSKSEACGETMSETPEMTDYE